MAIIPQVVTEASASGAQVIDGSLRFDGSKSQSLERTLTSDGNQTTWTWSAWVKADPTQVNSSGGFAPMFFGGLYNTSGQQTHIAFGGSGGTPGQLLFTHYSGAYTTNLRSSSRYRDIGWYHIVVVFDSNNSTSGDRARVYVNGERVTSWTSETYPSSGGTTWINNSSKFHGIGKDDKSATENCFSGHMSQVYFIDGQPLDPSYFGYTDPLTGTWRPKKSDIANVGFNDGRVWSSSLVLSSGGWNGAASNGFNASLTGNASGDTSGATITLNISTTITVGSLGVYAAVTSGDPIRILYKLDGVTKETLNTGSSGAQWYSNASYAGEIDQIVISRDNRAPEFRAIKVNGQMLVDSVDGWGINGFYLPMDGNFLLGQDKSGKGNDWIPVNTGGSTVIPKATGALPILNTVSGGRVVVPGVIGGGPVGVAVTVYNSGSGNKYYLDGEEAKSLSKYRGQTITFDQSDSTNASHPLKFATAADAAGSTEYTSGVVYAGTPGTSAHYGVDLDGNDYLKIEQTSSQFSGQSDYTVEAWAKFDSFQDDGALWSNWNSGGSRSILLECNNDGYQGFRFMINDGSWTTINNSRPLIPNIGQWYHLCQTYDHSATTTKCYIDGVFYGENTSITVNNDPNADLYIGINQDNASGEIDGQVTNFRWSNSVRYTSNFTPSKVPFTTDGNTVFLGCLDSSSPTTAVTNNAGTISSSGDPSVYTVTNLYGPYTKITFPSTAPNTLYYYCGNHTGMGGSISLSTDIQVADPDAWKCVLALPLVGNSNDVSNQMNSESNAMSVRDTGAVASSKTSNFYGGSYYFDGSDDHLNITAETGIAVGTGDFTLELFVYFSGTDSTLDTIMESRSSTGSDEGFLIGRFHTSGHENKIELYTASDYRVTGDVVVGNNTWTHVAVVRSSSVTKMYINGRAYSSTYSDSNNYSYDSLIIGENINNQYQLEGYIQDFRIYKGAAKYTSDFIPASIIPDIFPETPSGVVYSSELIKPSDGAVAFDGTGDYLSLATSSDFEFGTGDYTIEFWFYRTATGQGNIYEGRDGGNTNRILFYVNGSNQLSSYINASQNNGGTLVTGVWYHAALSRKSGTNRMFLDGILQTSWADTVDVDAPSSTLWIGQDDPGSNDFEGFLSNLRVVKGTALYTADFTPSLTPLTNVTNTKLLCCQSNTSAVNYAVSPGAITANGNAAASIFNPFDTDIDIVRGKSTGYCTWNPLDNYQSIALSSDNLGTSKGSTSGYVNGTLSMPPGQGKKWYWEVTIPSDSATSGECYAGVASRAGSTNAYFDQYGVQLKISGDPYFYTNGNTSNESVGAWSPGQVLGLGFDPDAGILRFYRDGALIHTTTGIPTSGTKTPYLPAIQAGTGASEVVYSNFGQNPFKVPPPEGFLPLCNADLPTPVLIRPDQYFSPLLYTSNNSTLSVSGYQFQPDLLMFKNRTTGNHWGWFDSVRGANEWLRSSSGSGQVTTSGGGYGTGTMNSFDRNGFTLGNDVGANVTNYPSNNGHVVYGFKAGGNKGTFNIDDKSYATVAAAGLDGGTIDPSGASVGTEQGFSILKYTGNGSAGATFAHGLTKAPDMVIVKRTDGTEDWGIYAGRPTGVAGAYFKFESSALNNVTAGFNSTDTTSTLVTLGNNNLTNGNTMTYVAYAWHSVEGVQKFGVYTANGAVDGSFISLGFRPALVWIKATFVGSDPRDWFIYDNKRNPYNPTAGDLQLNTSDAEGTVGSGYYVDFLSNGFKLRANGNGMNGSSGLVYYYCAWAEQPEHNLYGGQSNAR